MKTWRSLQSCATLKPADGPGMEAEAGAFGVDSVISGAEIAEVVKQLHGGKHPGMDEIPLNSSRGSKMIGYLG